MIANEPAAAGRDGSGRGEMVHQRPVIVLMILTALAGIALTWYALNQ